MEIPKNTKRGIFAGIGLAILLTAFTVFALKASGAGEGWTSFWGALLGGLIGGATTLLAAVVAWQSTKAAIDDGKKARADAELARLGQFLSDQLEALILAQSFIVTVKDNATGLISNDHRGKRYKTEPASHRALEWLSGLQSDAMANQAMTLPPVHCRTQIWQTVKQATYSANTVLMAVNTTMEIDHNRIVILIEAIELSCQAAMSAIANAKTNIETEMINNGIRIRPTN